MPSTSWWGILVDDLPVLERAGLGFVGVADQVDRFVHCAEIDERPLHATGKARAAPAAQARELHFLTEPQFLRTGDQSCRPPRRS